MANRTLFKSLLGKLIPATDALNESTHLRTLFRQSTSSRSTRQLVV